MRRHLTRTLLLLLALALLACSCSQGGNFYSPAPASSGNHYALQDFFMKWTSYVSLRQNKLSRSAQASAEASDIPESEGSGDAETPDTTQQPETVQDAGSMAGEHDAPSRTEEPLEATEAALALAQNWEDSLESSEEIGYASLAIDDSSLQLEATAANGRILDARIVYRMVEDAEATQADFVLGASALVYATGREMLAADPGHVVSQLLSALDAMPRKQGEAPQASATYNGCTFVLSTKGDDEIWLRGTPVPRGAPTART